MSNQTDKAEPGAKSAKAVETSNSASTANSVKKDGLVDDLLAEMRNLVVSFQTDDEMVDAVRGIDLTLHRGRFTALVGESGAGKSVIARALMRLLPDTARISKNSVIEFQGNDIRTMSERQVRGLCGNRISMIFQEPMSSLNPVYTVGTQISEVIRQHRWVSRKEAMASALRLLQEVHIPEPEYRLAQFPHQLSGGQRQRVMIAIALANEPDLLIADEPTTALDVTVQAQILLLLKELQRKHRMGVLLITHDLTIVKNFSDEVYVMYNGKIREYGHTAKLFREPTDPYTRHLIASEPDQTPPDARITDRVILEAKQVRVAFALRKGGVFSRQKTELIAVNNLDISLKQGETLALVGESGSGKTTLGQALLRLIPCQAASICFNGVDIHEYSRSQIRLLRTDMQIVFQDPFSSLNLRMNIRRILEEGMISTGLGSGAADRYGRVRKALVDSGLPTDIMNRFPHEFSGGQRQRIAVARTIALEPEFIVLDELTSALDLSVQAQIIKLLLTLQREKNLSYLFIAHDLRVVRALCHRIVVMHHGNVVETGPTAQVLDQPKEDYTKRLVRAAFHVEA